MQLKTIFSQDINRSIETVIKADDQDHIAQEVTEYVVTREIAKKVADFFDGYKNYQNANGVWISGFFGSGKSHLLKILSYVLENKEYDGVRIGEQFANKITDDEILRGNVLNAARIPSESILFNIDQQAQITSKQDEDAILSVFYKVLYDHLGYYGAQRHVAEFELWLDEEGKYSAFMDEYEAQSGNHWNTDRRKYFAPAVKTAIAKALGKINNDNPDQYADILDTLRRDNAISIEHFCEKVQAYIKTKPAGFRLNFFVDEAGQYISENTKLMLNLQTLAETLATKLKGQAWILVTSQEDIEKITGDMNARQQNDFSRIQARFFFKISLTSANVDEVIEKRLLAKTDEAKAQLKNTWAKEHANLETLVTFSEVGVQFKRFQDEDDFIRKYPFIPYQFDLFQQCIRALSAHNAFQGKHASVGERSMLGVFQTVVQRIQQGGDRQIVSFDLLFEGLRSTIRGEIQNAITLAERNLEHPLAIKVLKALFLVKYYSNFKATVRNVSVLMLDNIDVDLKAHEAAVEQALTVLELQTYVQRNGDLYEFLTDDEKDIEQEIKNTGIEDAQITNKLSELIFDEIIGDNRIKYAENKHEYEFTRKIDGDFVSRDRSELVIEIITPNNAQYGNETYYKTASMGYNTLLLLVLPPDDRLAQDIRMLLKTEKYVKQNQSTANKDNVKRILFDKNQQNAERRRNLVTLLKKLLGEAAVWLNGSKHEMPAVADGKTKVINAFQDLIKLAYPSLRMLGTVQYTEDMLHNILRARQDDLFGADDSRMSEAEAEILNAIVRRKKQSDRTTLSDLRDLFARKPYGWYPNAVWGVTARLYKRGKLELRRDTNLLNDNEVRESMLSSRLYANTLLEPQMDFDPAQVRQLKELYREFFDEACPVQEPRDVAVAFQQKADAEAQTLQQLLAAQSQYPFLAALQAPKDLLKKLGQKEYAYLLTHLSEFQEPLLDAKEDLLDPVKKFWNGEQKKIFDGILVFLQGNQANFAYVDSEELNTLREIAEHPRPFAGNAMRDAKAAMDSLSRKVKEKLETEREAAFDAVKTAMQRIREKEEFQHLSPGHQTQVLQPYETLLRELPDNRFIGNLRERAAYAQGELFTRQMNDMARLNLPLGTPGATEPAAQYIRMQSLWVRFDKNELHTPEDVDAYLEALKAEMLRHLKENRKITL